MTSKLRPGLKHRFPVYASQTRNPINFSVCVQPLYGNMNKSDLSYFVEWIESYRLFGVSEFHIYNESLQLSKDLENILRYYKGVVFMHQFSIHVAVNPVMTARPAYLDCIMKNYKRVEHLLILDIDEILAPRIHLNYSALFPLSNIIKIV